MRVNEDCERVYNNAEDSSRRVYIKVNNYMPIIRVKENENPDIALRKFKRACEKAGILSELRKREYYEKPTTKRKRKFAAAVKRLAKKLQKEAHTRDARRR